MLKSIFLQLLFQDICNKTGRIQRKHTVWLVLLATYTDWRQYQVLLGTYNCFHGVTRSERILWQPGDRAIYPYSSVLQQWCVPPSSKLLLMYTHSLYLSSSSSSSSSRRNVAHRMIKLKKKRELEVYYTQLFPSSTYNTFQPRIRRNRFLVVVLRKANLAALLVYGLSQGHLQ